MKIKHIAFLAALLLMLGSCRQEKILFYPDQLPENFKYNFEHEFREFTFRVDVNVNLNGVLFKADSSKGLVFFLHGNGGCIESWADCAAAYITNHYDFFVLDYRGYGKSQGRISSEKQLYNDLQIVYDSLKTLYQEKNIVIVGFSIGTGPATYLAAANNPGLLILQAPYYNMTDLAHHYIRILPSFLIKYKFKTNEYITKVKCPVKIFHGDMDEVIYVGSSIKLQHLFKPGDTLVILEGQKHNGIGENKIFGIKLKGMLQH